MPTVTGEDPRFLQPTHYVDCDAPAVRAFAEAATSGLAGPRERAIALFEAVRDKIRYDPYSISFDANAYRASHTAGCDKAWCVPKSILLTAAARAAGIPAAAGFADVRNHLNSDKLRALMGTDLFIYHGYTALWLGGRWVKATPAFNMDMCERFAVKPLVFDGETDALFHEFDTADNRHMEYVADRGISVDPPVEEVLAAMESHYPKFAAALRQDAARGGLVDGSFQHGT